MIVYHGSNVVIPKPDNLHSQKYLDFGKGFYVTSFQAQAESHPKKWETNCKHLRFFENFEGLAVLSFKGDIEHWLDFVCACRKGEEIYRQYDIVVGSVANNLYVPTPS